MSTTSADEGPEGQPADPDRDGGRLDGRGRRLLAAPRGSASRPACSGALIAWTIAGAGMLMLAFVFQRLAIRKPDLDAGVFAYAKAGFGDYVGFNSAFGFWASACAGNTSYWVLIMTTTSALFPASATATPCSRSIVFVGRRVAVLLPDPARRQGRGGHQPDRHVAKVVPILVFIVIAVDRVQGRRLRRQLLGRRRPVRPRRSSSRPRARC